MNGAGNSCGPGRPGGRPMPPPATGFLPSAVKVMKWFVPRGDLAVSVDAAFERMESADAVEVVRHVVLTHPLQLDRLADPLGDHRNFADIVVHDSRRPKPPPTRV